MKSHDITAEKIIEITKSWIDTPYLHQASAKGAGADCLGVVRGVWREAFGKEPLPVPPYSPTWYNQGDGEALLNAAETYLSAKKNAYAPANILVFRMLRTGPAKHMGIVTAENRFVHAYAGRAVTENWLTSFWTTRIAGVFSFPGVNS